MITILTSGKIMRAVQGDRADGNLWAIAKPDPEGAIPSDRAEIRHNRVGLFVGAGRRSRGGPRGNMSLVCRWQALPVSSSQQ